MSASTDPSASPAQAESRPRNGVGRAALVVGLVTVLIQVAETVLARVAPFIQSSLGMSASSIAVLFAPFTAAAGITGLVALILGIVGLTRRGLPKGAAGAGTALGGSAVLVVGVGLLTQLVYALAV